MSTEQTKNPDSQWSSLLANLKRVGDRSTRARQSSSRLSQFRIAAAVLCYVSLAISGLGAIFVSVQTTQLAVEPVAIGWATLSCWFVFYHWAQRNAKSWTASISLFFSLATSAALAMFCLQYVDPAGLTGSAMSKGYVQAQFSPFLKGSAFVLFSFVTATLFHFVTGFYVTEG